MAGRRNTVNYIKHLSAVGILFTQDERMSPWHISLYYALFHIWNSTQFKDKISINRAELMQASKIGSANTYTKCLKQLDEWGYIKYLPSHNPMVGSLVNLYSFDKTTDTTTDKSSDNSTDKTTDTTAVTLVRPYINNNKHIKEKKPLNERKEKFKKPSIQEVIDFFSEKKHDQVDAEKFFNHFESNGWLVSGKTPMKNWQAAARNWMINSEKFQTNKNQPSAGNLNVNQNKDYSVPL